MTYHYVEYVYLGDKCTTREYGPLDDVAGSGLLREIVERGGVVTGHWLGSYESVENAIDIRYHDEQQEIKTLKAKAMYPQPKRYKL